MRDVKPGELWEKWYRVDATESGLLRIRARLRVVGEFAELFELFNFPFDRQALTIDVRTKKLPHLVHLAMPASELEMGSFNVESFVHQGSWNLARHIWVWETRSLPTETRNVPPVIYPQLKLRLRVVRKYSQYVNDVMLPQGLLSLMAMTSLLVGRDSLGERLAITLTMVLSSIAFKTTISSLIPSIAYFTQLDRYLWYNFLFLFLLILADITFMFCDLEFSSRMKGRLEAAGLDWIIWAYHADDDDTQALEALLFAFFSVVCILGLIHFAFHVIVIHEANMQWLDDFSYLVGEKKSSKELIIALAGSRKSIRVHDVNTPEGQRSRTSQPSPRLSFGDLTSEPAVTANAECTGHTLSSKCQQQVQVHKYKW